MNVWSSDWECSQFSELLEFVPIHLFYFVFNSNFWYLVFFFWKIHFPFIFQLICVHVVRFLHLQHMLSIMLFVWSNLLINRTKQHFLTWLNHRGLSRPICLLKNIDIPYTIIIPRWGGSTCTILHTPKFFRVLDFRFPMVTPPFVTYQSIGKWP